MLNTYDELAVAAHRLGYVVMSQDELDNLAAHQKHALNVLSELHRKQVETQHLLVEVLVVLDTIDNEKLGDVRLALAKIIGS